MKKLGVIGGLGPMATAYFLQLVTQMSDAGTDQEHMEVLLHSKPQIPDRTRYILGQSTENPLPQITEVGRALVGQGAEVIAIPCVTAHYFQEQLEQSIAVPIIDAIAETVFYLRSADISSVGIMATDGTIESGLFQRAFDRGGIRYMIPDREGQRLVMHIIYENVKAGKHVEMPLFQNVAMPLFDGGAQVVLLACTELSLVRRDYCMGAGFLDVMEILARKAVLSCGRLRKDYEDLIKANQTETV